MSLALPNECFFHDETTGGVSLYYAEKNDGSGEEAFFAARAENFEIGRTDGIYTEILRGDWMNKEFIRKSDRPFSDKERVVIASEGEP